MRARRCRTAAEAPRNQTLWMRARACSPACVRDGTHAQGDQHTAMVWRSGRARHGCARTRGFVSHRALSEPASGTSGRPCSTRAFTPRGRPIGVMLRSKDRRNLPTALMARTMTSPCPAQQLARCLRATASRRKTWVLAVALHAVHVGGGDASSSASSSAKPTHFTMVKNSSSPRRRRAERLLGNQLGQDHGVGGLAASLDGSRPGPTRRWCRPGSARRSRRRWWRPTRRIRWGEVEL